MANLEFDQIISLGKILRSKTCLLILNYLTNKDASNIEVFNELKQQIDTDNRSTVFEALKRMKKAGLINKYYSDMDKEIKYKLISNNLSINLKNMKHKLELIKE
jgi:Fe2+ or Zn2+ uptake regulation protein